MDRTPDKTLANSWVSEVTSMMTRDDLSTCILPIESTNTSTQPNTRGSRWYRVLLWVVFAIWVSFLCWLLVFLTRVSLSGPFLGTACRPDGSFSPFGDDFRWWSKGGFFQITIGFGPLTFVQVKAIDVVWDLVVGRLGQAILVCISWRAFADYVATLIATHPITYSSFWVIFLHQEASLASLFSVTRDTLPGGPGFLHSKMATAFVISTMLYIISFPTLVSSMSGYTPANEAFVKARDSSLIPFSEFHKTAFVIHNGDGIGLGKDYVVPYVRQANSPRDPTVYQGVPSDTDLACPYKLGDEQARACSMIDEASAYINTYGLANSSIPSKWQNLTLNITLNITPFYFQVLADRNDLYGSAWLQKDPSRRAYSAKDQVYLLDYIKANGTCQPVTIDQPCDADVSDADSCSIQMYLWGFSYIQLFLNAILLILWTVGVFIVWHKAHLKLPLCDYPEVPRGWKAVRELSHAMDKGFDDFDIDADGVTDSRLKNEIRRRMKGGRIGLRGTLERPDNGFRAYMPREKGKWMKRGLIVYAAGLVAVFFTGMYILTTRETNAVVKGKVWIPPDNKLIG